MGRKNPDFVKNNWIWGGFSDFSEILVTYTTPGDLNRFLKVFKMNNIGKSLNIGKFWTVFRERIQISGGCCGSPKSRKN